MLSNIDLLRRVPLFSLLTSLQVQVLRDAVSKQRFKRGQVVVEQGHQSDTLFIVITGRARVVVTDARGREVILARLGPGDCIGEMSLIDHQPHSASVCAEVQTDVLLLGRQEFLHCLATNASMSLAVMEGLVKRLRHADRKIESLALLDVYGRVAHALLDFVEIDADGQQVIREKVSRQDVAKMVGASREMVSRVMKDLEDRQWIEVLGDGSLRLKSGMPRLNAP